MKMLHERLGQKEQDLAVLQAEIALLKSLIAETNGTPLASPAPKTRSPRSFVKNLVLELLSEVKNQGLNATLAVEMAATKGHTLDRGSVSSLLSRLKETGLLAYDGKVYRLKEFLSAHGVPNTQPQSGWVGASVVQHPASRAVSS